MGAHAAIVGQALTIDQAVGAATHLVENLTEAAAAEATKVAGATAQLGATAESSSSSGGSKAAAHPEATSQPGRISGVTALKASASVMVPLLFHHLISTFACKSIHCSLPWM